MSTGSGTTLVKPVRTMNTVKTPKRVKEDAKDSLTTASGRGAVGSPFSLFLN